MESSVTTMLSTIQLCVWSRTIQICNTAEYENCLLCSRNATGKEQRQSPSASPPIYPLFFDKALIRERGKITHGIKNMIEYVIIKGKWKFQSLNMDLQRSAKHRRRQGVIKLLTPAWFDPPLLFWSVAFSCYCLINFYEAFIWWRIVNFDVFLTLPK